MPLPTCLDRRKVQQEVEETWCERISCNIKGVYTIGLCISRFLSEKICSTWTRKIGIKTRRQILRMHLAPNQNSGMKRSIARDYPKVCASWAQSLRAPKFEDRSHEETLHQEGCARFKETRRARFRCRLRCIKAHDEQTRFTLRRDGHNKKVQNPQRSVDCKLRSGNPRGDTGVRSWLESVRHRASTRRNASRPIAGQALQRQRICGPGWDWRKYKRLPDQIMCGRKYGPYLVKPHRIEKNKNGKKPRSQNSTLLDDRSGWPRFHINSQMRGENWKRPMGAALPCKRKARTSNTKVAAEEIALHHIRNVSEIHSVIRSGLIPGGTCLKRDRQSVFFTAVNPMDDDQINEEMRCDLDKPRIVPYKSAWRHHNTVYWNVIKIKCIFAIRSSLTREDCSFIKHDHTQSFSTTHCLRSVLTKRYALRLNSQRWTAGSTWPRRERILKLKYQSESELSFGETRCRNTDCMISGIPLSVVEQQGHKSHRDGQEVDSEVRESPEQEVFPAGLEKERQD